MAKKKKLESHAPVPMTRGQLSRAQREQQQIRNLYTAGIAVGAVVVLLLAFSVIFTFLIRPNSEVARVNDTVINRDTYNKFRRWSLFQQIQQAALQDQLSQQTGTAATGTQTEQLRQQLLNVENETVDQQTVMNLVDSEVLRQASAKDWQIVPTNEELKAAAVKDFIPTPTEPPSSETPTAEPTATVASAVTGTVTLTATLTPAATNTPTSTPTRGSPTSTPTATSTLPPVPGAQQTAESVYSRYVKAITNGSQPNAQEPICGYGCPGLNEQDYLNLIIQPRVLRDQVTEKIDATQLITQVEMIHAQHILTDTEEGAKAIRARLDAGEDFTQLANEQSSEQINNIKNGAQPNGGDLGWFPQENSNLVPEFVAGAWPVKAGEYSQPVKTSFGWHIIKVLERDPKRQLDATQIENEKQRLFNEWYDKAKLAMRISPAFAQAPTPTAPPLVEPTLPPSGSPTTGTGQNSQTDAAQPTPTTNAGTERNTPAPTGTTAP